MSMTATAPGGTPPAATSDPSTAPAPNVPPPAVPSPAVPVPAAPSPTTTPGGPDGPAGSDDAPWTDPDRARREIERLRRENGDARINAKKTAADEARAELLQTLTAALNPEAQAALTPEQIAEQLGQATQQLADVEKRLADTAKERAVALEAWKAGLNPARLDYLAFQLSRNPEYGALDASDVDLGTKIADVISKEVAKDSTLRLSGAAIASGVEQLGGASGASTMTKAEFANLPYVERVAIFNTNRAEYDRLNS